MDNYKIVEVKIILVFELWCIQHLYGEFLSSVEVMCCLCGALLGAVPSGLADFWNEFREKNGGIKNYKINPFFQDFRILETVSVCDKRRTRCS
jgi:hypothetical protein